MNSEVRIHRIKSELRELALRAIDICNVPAEPALVLIEAVSATIDLHIREHRIELSPVCVPAILALMSEESSAIVRQLQAEDLDPEEAWSK